VRRGVQKQRRAAAFAALLRAGAAPREAKAIGAYSVEERAQ